MVSDIELLKIIQQDNFTLDINAIAPTARDLLFKKNLILSPNLTRSPLYQRLRQVAEEKFNEQIVIDDSTLNLNTSLHQDWVDNVGGYDQESEKNRLVFQNTYRDATLPQFTLTEYKEPYSSELMIREPKNNKEVNLYTEYRSGSERGVVVERIPRTADNVGDFRQNIIRDAQLSRNIYTNTDKTPFIIDYNTNKNIDVDYIEQLKNLGIDVNTDINKDKLDYSWKDSLKTVGGGILGTVTSKYNKVPITTAFEVIKRVATFPNQTQLVKDSTKALKNQFGYNITQNITENISQGLDNLLNGEDPFKIMRYEITVGGTNQNLFGKTIDFLGDLTGIKKLYEIPKEVSILSSDHDIKEGEVFDWIGNSNNLLQYTGKGQVKSLTDNLNQNKYKPDYYYSDLITTRKGSIKPKLYHGFDNTNNSFSEWQNLDFGVQTIGNSNGDVSKSRFSWEEGNPSQIQGIFSDLASLFNEDSLLGKTQKLINEQELGSLINRKGVASTQIESGEIYTGLNALGEYSKGNNVIKRGAVDGTGSVNANGRDEFCRVWTFYDQYDRPSKFIRKSKLINRSLIKRNKTKDKNGNDTFTYTTEQTNKSLQHSVLDDNGYVQIAPYSKDSEQLNNESWKAYENAKLPIKKYMFSLENLAWSDPESLAMLHPSEIGNGDPTTGNRGRIMWFPPYNLKIGQAFNSNLERTDFIGRGEPILTYNNTTSNLTLGFTLLVDHPSDINKLKKGWLEDDNNFNERDGSYGRFFAGCDMGTRDSVKDIEKEIKNINEGIEVINGVTKSTNIKVYFPNDVADDVNDIITSPFYETFVGTYPSAPLSINIDTARWSLSENYATALSNGSIDTKLTVDIKPPTSIMGRSKKFNIKLEPNYNTSLYTGVNIEQPIDTFSYKINILNTDNFITSIDSNVSGSEMKQRLFFNGPTESRSNVRGLSVYTGITTSLGNNQNLNEILSQTESNVIYSELKNIINNVKNSQDKKLTIVVKGYASKDGSKRSWGTASTRINGFLAARRANTVLNSILPAIFTGDLKIESNFEIDLRVELYADTVTGGQNRPNDKSSIEGRFVDIVITSNASESKWVSGNLQETQATQKQDLKKQQASEYVKSLPNEVDYFNKIDLEDRIIYDTLTEKINFFHPVFHSQTPEGMSSRLTFLQQCMRQGPTLKGSGNAHNLAFGKQPVCILRVGDFLNTKVMIESLNIDYEQIWDLNPEGVGVQPMIAHVTLNIVPMGGSDIAGPINELQNAVSFNYYANTSIFDPRANSAEDEANKRIQNSNKK